MRGQSEHHTLKSQGAASDRSSRRQFLAQSSKVVAGSVGNVHTPTVHICKDQRTAFANLASIMGRAAIHSGKIVTWEEVTASDFTFCPNVAKLTYDSPAPVQADAQGRYPVPIPGQWSEV